jgi:polyribonucleotide nucleotidyltransferase
LIYPNASKFEESYQMPFYEMISRFQISLRATNTTLMIIGYSFGDAHVNRMIEEAVDSNLSLKVIAVDPNIEEVDGEKTKEERENLKNMLINHAKNSARIMFFGATFKDFVKELPEISYENEREKTLKEALDEALKEALKAPEKNEEKISE